MYVNQFRSDKLQSSMYVNQLRSDNQLRLGKEVQYILLQFSLLCTSQLQSTNKV